MSTRGTRTAFRSPVLAASAAPHIRPRSEPPLALAGRILLALVFLVGAAFNALVTLRNPESLRGFADLLIAFEATVGVLLLARGAAVRLALLAALAFYVVLVPVLREFGLVNLPFLVLALALLRHEYPETVAAEVRACMAGRLRRGRTGSGRGDDANRK